MISLTVQSHQIPTMFKPPRWGWDDTVALFVTITPGTVTEEEIIEQIQSLFTWHQCNSGLQFIYAVIIESGLQIVPTNVNTKCPVPAK